MTEKEKTLLAGCVNGEKAAWDAFVLQYSALVYHTIRKTLTLHHTEARDDVMEDLYQEFFLSLLKDGCRKLGQFRGDHGCSLATWLRVIAARLTIDFLRKQSPPTGEASVGLPVDQTDSAYSLIEQERATMLAHALETLPAKDRILVDLFFRQALPPEEIAAIFKTSVSAVYTQKSRVLDKIREILKNSGSL
jgi:RNA polymerase sigma factor (sigma-70 family)